MLDALKGSLKGLASALGMLLTVLTFTHNLPFLPATWTAAAGVVIAVLTPVLTWLVPNKPASVTQA